MIKQRQTYDVHAQLFGSAQLFVSGRFSHPPWFFGRFPQVCGPIVQAVLFSLLVWASGSGKPDRRDFCPPPQSPSWSF